MKTMMVRFQNLGQYKEAQRHGTPYSTSLNHLWTLFVYSEPLEAWLKEQGLTWTR